jgi:hypothetical protein
MKSRVAVVLVLSLGIFMSGTGATLAVSGMSSSGSASSAQYPNEAPKHHGKPHTLGVHSSGGNGSATPAAAVETEVVQPAAQVATNGGDSLPFTGFVAIPVLLVGVALLGGGMLMRNRIRAEDRP